MSYLLTSPTAALVVSSDEGLATAIETGAVPAGVSTVYTATDGDGGATVIEDRDDLGVVLVTDDVDGGLEAACSHLSAVNERLPVVVVATGADPAALARATQAGASTVVDADDRDGLATAIDDALETFERRRREHADSGMFATLLEDGHVSIYAKDEQGRHLRLANVPGAADPKNAIGRTDAELYGDQESAEDTITDDERVIEAGEPIRDRMEHFETEGADVWTRTTKIPWRDDDGAVQGLVGISLNVTDEMTYRRRLEAFEERFDSLASKLSHDLKSPLQVASGHLELARETGDEAAFDKVDASLDRMQEMIADLSFQATEDPERTFEYIEADGGLDEVLEPTSIAAVLEEIWGVVGTAEATLENRFPEDALVVCAEGTIRPPLENLVRNAIQHGGHSVTVTVGPLVDWDGLYVADDGPGVPPDEREAVFADGYTTHPDGTGTGLSIVAESIDSAGWTLDLTESADGGARFEIGNCPTVAQTSRSMTETVPLDLEEGRYVGEVDVPGGESYDADRDEWTVTGGGLNIWNQDNEFRFVHTRADGPVRIQGRILEPATESDYSKAGFMVRDDLDTAATYGAVGVTPEYGTELLWRYETGADGVSQHFGTRLRQFAWYRVDRVDDVVTCYGSTDGETWYPLDQRRVALEDPVAVGLVVNSYVPDTAAEATFGDVSVHRLDVAE